MRLGIAGLGLKALPGSGARGLGRKVSLNLEPNTQKPLTRSDMSKKNSLNPAPNNHKA